MAEVSVMNAHGLGSAQAACLPCSRRSFFLSAWLIGLAGVTRKATGTVTGIGAGSSFGGSALEGGGQLIGAECHGAIVGACGEEGSFRCGGGAATAAS